jgi:hypothetical protein
VTEELSGYPLGRMPVTIQLEECIVCQNDILDENHEDKTRRTFVILPLKQQMKY